MIKKILFFLITISTLHFAQTILAESNTDDLSSLDLFGEVFYKIKTDYVEDQSNQTLVEAAINGMLSSLDPHSSYLDKKTFDEMKTHIKGEFGGIGIEVIMDNGLVQIISPIEDTPAYKAGLKAGDYIIMIDDETVMSMSFSEAVKKMRGSKGTQLNLTVLREGSKDPLEFKIIRDIINIVSVKSRTEGDIAYIKITTFAEKTAEETSTAFHNLKNKIGKNLKGLIIDLRGNPGGSFDQAIAVSNLFLGEGEIVSTRGKNKDNTTRYRAKSGKIMVRDNLPMIVLIDGGSASASEIVAGALQDHKKAIIMGTQSFGKGTVQTVIPLPGDSGAMRLTTSRYYTPSGKSIQAEGITPDIAIEQAKIEFPNISNKFKYKESAFKNHLTKESKEEIKALTKEEKEKEHKKALDAISKKDTIKTVEDYQLARAIDLLKTIQFLGLEKALPSQIKSSEK